MSRSKLMAPELEREREISYQLFCDGLSISQISRNRGLDRRTIIKYINLTRDELRERRLDRQEAMLDDFISSLSTRKATALDWERRFRSVVQDELDREELERQQALGRNEIPRASRALSLLRDGGRSAAAVLDVANKCDELIAKAVGLFPSGKSDVTVNIDANVRDLMASMDREVIHEIPVPEAPPPLLEFLQ